jgi:cobalt-precorrin-5B (C1)-methyltransferase
MSLRCGITTGACAAAAAKAAVTVLAGGAAPGEVDLGLPSGQSIRLSILYVESRENPPATTAAVRKDAGDDPDVTDGLEVRATLSWDDTADATFIAGEGVGTVTKPGLQVPPGEPAINPVPRQMILGAIREVTRRGVRVEISVPGGREIAAKTFNPRLGIVGGLSILGTTGIVRPYCTRALHDALRCTLDVAAACQVTAPVLVPGNVGARAARRHFALRDEQLIEVGNAWGFVVDLLPPRAFSALLLVGHPGKLAKLAAGHWDTHSAHSSQATLYLGRLCAEVLGHPAPDSTTAEGVFAALRPQEKKTLADELAGRVRAAVAGRLGSHLPVAVLLVNMAGECLGSDGDFAPWQ